MNPVPVSVSRLPTQHIPGGVLRDTAFHPTHLTRPIAATPEQSASGASLTTLDSGLRPSPSRHSHADPFHVPCENAVADPRRRMVK